MVALFIQEMPATLEKMRDALECNDLDTLASLVHRTKPTIYNMSIEDAREDILFLEACRDKDQEQVTNAFKRFETLINNVVKKLSIEKNADNGGVTPR